MFFYILIIGDTLLNELLLPCASCDRLVIKRFGFKGAIVSIVFNASCCQLRVVAQENTY